jgi:acetyl esterase/lipase
MSHPLTTLLLVKSALILFLTSLSATAQMLHQDISYAKAGAVELTLDLHTPGTQSGPLIVYIHGGAWRSGDKADVPILDLLSAGFPIASVNYRLTPEAPFPANIHDIKAAIRFLRATQTDHRIDATRIAIIGSSAGGHLAALVGVTNGHPELEGKIGTHLDQSSSVQAIVSFYGASNLTTILSQSTSHGLKVRVPALQLLLGSQPTENPALAKLASPVFHLDKNDPPLLLIHGDADPQMPPDQSAEFAAAYRQHKLKVEHIILPGSVHGGPEFCDPQQLERVKRLLDAIP